MVKVIIGTELAEAEATFEMYKGVLIFHSDHFRSAFSGRFSEAQDGILRLPGDDPAAFTYFKNWLYTRTLQVSNRVDCQAMETEAIVKVYIFADCRQIPALANSASRSSTCRSDGPGIYPAILSR